MTWRDRYFEHFYEGRPSWQNGTEQFHKLIQRHLQPTAGVLELGSGSSNRTTALLAQCSAFVDGIDIDPEIETNEALRRRVVYDGRQFPIADNSYDAVVTDYVLEHVEDPVAVLGEVTRVLKPHGVFLFRTPNLYHYVSLASYLSPHWLHVAIARYVRATPDAVEPYPTFYRLNTNKQIRRLCDQASLSAVEVQMVEKEPSYGKFSRIAFLGGVAYERFVNSADMFGILRANIFGVFRKQTSDNQLRSAA